MVMKRLLTLAAIANVMVLGTMAASGPAAAVVPGTNGRVLFARCIFKARDCQWELVAADADGANETVLAGPYPRSVWDDHFIANWSPDGRNAIFMADLGHGQRIWQVDADGSHLHMVWSPPPDGTGLDDGPAYTPDGKHIVFTRCCPQGYGYSLWMINADGGGLKDVTTEWVRNGDGPSDNLPQVSPSGRAIVFHRCFPNPDRGCVVDTVGINGDHRHQLTDPSLNAQDPNWSPDS